MVKAMQQHCPDILQATQACMSKSRLSTGKAFTELTLDPGSFADVREDSIDYSVMEQADNVAVVPCNIGWSDIGSWSALGDLSAPDEHGNRIDGEAQLHDVRNDRIVGAVGVSDLIIVDTPDALLVVDKSRAQDVKHLYAALKAKGHDAHKHHITMHRPWGTYTVLEEDPSYKIKRIEVKPGGCLSLQMHHHRSEHWIVVSGMAKVVNGETSLFLRTNESTYIPAGHRHRLENPGMLNLVMIEVQSGEYLGEDDIVRFEDSYGRV
jgi:mannose-1-phosphate guanylyltransferase / mannose-6-phosphate isomerase